MASIKKRKLKTKTTWVVRYQDANGKDRYISCGTSAEADLVRAQKEGAPGLNPHLSFQEIADAWFAVTEVKVRPQTADVYRTILRLHVLPKLGFKRIGKIRRSDIESVLVEKLKSGLKVKTVYNIKGVIYGVLQRAVRDGVLMSNPADGLGRELGLRRYVQDNDAVQAFTADELEHFLSATKRVYQHLYPAFLTMARTGIRIGEMIALRWPDIDFAGTMRSGEHTYQILIERKMTQDGRVETTKTEKSRRRVDMGPELRGVLREFYGVFLKESMKSGRSLEDWVFQRPRPYRGEGAYLRQHTVDYQFKKILWRAGLPEHFHPHSLRHTFASVHCQLGTDTAYLMQQLGHSSIQMTIDVYGHWLSKTNMRAASRLENAAALLLKDRQKGLDI